MNSNEVVDAQPMPPVEALMVNPANNGMSSTTQSQQSRIYVSNENTVDYPITRAPVEKDSSYYNMNHKRRGDAVIFHHTKFDSNLDLEERRGDEHLLKRLTAILADSFEFNVTVCKDLDYKRIDKKIKTLAKKNHKNSDCILMVFMTHGCNGKLYARDTHYNPDGLRSQFTSDKCPTLAGKPKIFIIQACRGGLLNEGTSFTLGHIPPMSSTETDGPRVCYKIPTHADFLVVDSTVSSYTAYRTWFIEALCKVLESEENRKDDFLSMMTTVLREVAIEYEGELRHKQIPSLRIQLTRKIYFTQKKRRLQNKPNNVMSCINSNVLE